MAWNPSPKVADCRDIARKWGGKEQVIIISISDKGEVEAASYGHTVSACKCAEVFMTYAIDAIERRVRLIDIAQECRKSLTKGAK